MAEERSGPPAAERVVVAMKGHPGSGKSTAARAIASALRCPLLDKDDVRDCTLHLERAAGDSGMLNELSYAVLWRLAERQLQLGLSVVVDCPLSRPTHLDRLARLPAALVVVVECRPGDEAEWRRRLEERGGALADGGGDGWHKPKSWAELERLVEGYQGCTDYDTGDVPRIFVDTTDPMVGSEAIAARVVDFIRSLVAHAH
jgi:predicted kinase